MADKYESKYRGEQIDAYLDDVATLKEQQAENAETLSKAISSLTGRVDTIENKSYVTTSQFNDALGAYITKIDALIGGDT